MQGNSEKDIWSLTSDLGQYLMFTTIVYLNSFLSNVALAYPYDLSKVTNGYSRTDKEISELITQQINVMPFLPGEWIEVEVVGGVVKLKGCVRRPKLKAFAASATWELSGVRDCINKIEIRERQREIRVTRSDSSLGGIKFSSSHASL